MAELSQGFDVVLVVEEETLDQEGRVQPGAVEIFDEHPRK
jgi:hypothetical protein